MFSLTFLDQDYQGNYLKKYLFPTQVSFPNTKFSTGTTLAVDQNGGLVAGGWATRLMSNGKEQTVFALCRYLPSGVLDKKFGKNGTILYEFFKGENAFLMALAIDSKNNIIAAGTTGTSGDSKVAIAKFDASTGKSITGFGNGGNIICDKIGEQEYQCAYSIAIDHHDNGFYVACNFMYILRFLSSGKIDSAFNNGEPILVTPPSGWRLVGRIRIALDYFEERPWGIVVGCGLSHIDSYKPRIFLGRYSAKGEPDYNFANEAECGINGWKRYDKWPAIFASLAIDGEHGYIVAATGRKDNIDQFFLMRCNGDEEYGSDLALGFGGAGGVVFTASPSAKAQFAEDMIISSEGNIIVAGLAIVNNQDRVALAFYDKKGKPLKTNGDTSGCLLIDYGTPFLETTAVSAIAEYGKGSLAILTDGQCSKVGQKMYTPKDIFLTVFVVWVTAIAFINLP